MLAHQGQQQRSEAVTQSLVDVPDHAEIDQGDAPVGFDEEVARVRVGVEEAVPEHHLGHRTGRAGRQGRTVGPGGIEPRQVVDLQPVHPLQGQHPGGGGLPEDPGDTDGVVVGEVRRETFGVASFGEVVQFRPQRGGELLGNAGQVVVGGGLPMAAGPGGHVLQDLQVFLDLCGDPGSTRLDHDLGAVGQAGRMGLPQGCTGQRFFIEGGE